MQWLTLLGFIFFSYTLQAKIRVAIDPGHGGFDRGAIHGEVHEAKIALQISKKISRLLNKDSRFDAKLLRNKDIDLQLPTRVKKAKGMSTDIFISVHANSSRNAEIQGPEFYIQNQMPSEEESLFLANRENDQGQRRQGPPGKDAGNVESILFDLKKTQRILESYKISWYLKKRMRKDWKPKQKKHMIRQGPLLCPQPKPGTCGFGRGWIY